MINLMAEPFEGGVQQVGAVLVSPEGDIWAYCPTLKMARTLEKDHKARSLLKEVVRTFDLIILKGALTQRAEARVRMLRNRAARLTHGSREEETEATAGEPEGGLDRGPEVG